MGSVPDHCLSFYFVKCIQFPHNSYSNLYQWIFLILQLYFISEMSRLMTKPTICAPSEDSDQPGHLPSLISLCCALNG